MWKPCSPDNVIGQTSASEKRIWLLWVVHAHLLAGAERRLHDPQRPLTNDRLLWRPFGRITSMPATGQQQTLVYPPKADDRP
jgi:hypothetical protein